VLRIIQLVLEIMENMPMNGIKYVRKVTKNGNRSVINNRCSAVFLRTRIITAFNMQQELSGWKG
jgi:hypothetical protein